MEFARLGDRIGSNDSWWATVLQESHVFVVGRRSTAPKRTIRRERGRKGERGKGRRVMLRTSLLFLHPEDRVGDGRHAPAAYGDLNLDQLVDALIRGREEYDLAPLFQAFPVDREISVYRQEVFQDLEGRDASSAVRVFTASVQGVRQRLGQVKRFHYLRQKDRFYLDAVVTYVKACRTLSSTLNDAAIASRALSEVRDYLQAYVKSSALLARDQEAHEILRSLGEITYSIRVRGETVTVTPDRGEPKSRETIERTFARFRREEGREDRTQVPDSLEMDHVEAQILDRVARLFPTVFERLARFRADDASGTDFLDPVLVAFDREVQYYLAYLDFIEPVRRTGLPFCYPEFAPWEQGYDCESTFDLLLARKLVDEGRTPVVNDWRVEPGEGVFVLTGPNHGGKTTFARAVGQIHVLANLGFPTPGERARLPQVDRVLTHFEREERVFGEAMSKLEDDLVRIREILEQATPLSLVIVNEMLSSTTLRDGTVLGRRIVKQLLATGAISLWVTFIEPLATVKGAVSLVSLAGADGSPSYRVLRGAPGGVAHALAIARRYGLDHDTVRKSVGS